MKSSSARGFAIFLGLLVCFGVIAAGAGYLWWSSQGAGLLERGEEVMDEAAAFGAQTDETGCVDEALRRFEACAEGFSCHLMNNVFLRQCLQASAPVAGFCRGVPAVSSLARSVTWRLERCEELDLPGTYCGNLFGQLQEHCAGSREEDTRRAEHE